MLCLYICLCNIFTIHMCLLLMCCYQYMVMCFSVWLKFKCFCMRSPSDEGSQFSKFHFPWNKEEKLVSNSFFREYNFCFKKTFNPFKVLCHPVSCLLHLQIFNGKTDNTIRVYYILEQSKETILEFSKGATKVL